MMPKELSEHSQIPQKQSTYHWQFKPEPWNGSQHHVDTEVLPLVVEQ